MTHVSSYTIAKTSCSISLYTMNRPRVHVSYPYTLFDGLTMPTALITITSYHNHPHTRVSAYPCKVRNKKWQALMGTWTG